MPRTSCSTERRVTGLAGDVAKAKGAVGARAPPPTHAGRRRRFGCGEQRVPRPRPPPASRLTRPPATRRGRCCPRSTAARWSSCCSGIATAPTTAPPTARCTTSTATAARSWSTRWRSPGRGLRGDDAPRAGRQAPTMVVIGGDQARAIAGYTEVTEVDQTVSDLGGNGFEVKRGKRLTGFGEVADDVCRRFDFDGRRRRRRRPPGRLRRSRRRPRWAPSRRCLRATPRAPGGDCALANGALLRIVAADTSLRAHGARATARGRHGRGRLARPRLRLLVDRLAPRLHSAACPTSASRSTCATPSARPRARRRATAARRRRDLRRPRAGRAARRRRPRRRRGLRRPRAAAPPTRPPARPSRSCAARACSTPRRVGTARDRGRARRPEPRQAATRPSWPPTRWRGRSGPPSRADARGARAPAARSSP